MMKKKFWDKEAMAVHLAEYQRLRASDSRASDRYYAAHIHKPVEALIESAVYRMDPQRVSDVDLISTMRIYVLEAIYSKLEEGRNAFGYLNQIVTTKFLNYIEGMGRFTGMVDLSHATNKTEQVYPADTLYSDLPEGVGVSVRKMKDGTYKVRHYDRIFQSIAKVGTIHVPTQGFPFIDTIDWQALSEYIPDTDSLSRHKRLATLVVQSLSDAMAAPDSIRPTHMIDWILREKILEHDPNATIAGNDRMMILACLRQAWRLYCEDFGEEHVEVSYRVDLRTDEDDDWR